MRWSTVALLIAGSAILAQPISVAARCYDVGTPQFRCDPIVSDALRKRTTPGYVNPYARSQGTFTYEGQNYSAGSGANRYRYTYSDSLGKTERGMIETFPGGAVRHRGSWRQ